MSQLNHNAAYLTEIDGLTVWERLRVIRNFILDREQASELSALKLEQLELSLVNFNEDDKTALDYYDMKEKLIFLPQSKALLEDAKRELTFLRAFEEKLKLEAEKTRIEGKTDEEMYEINYFEELAQIRVLEVQSEMISLGHISPSTMKTLLRNPEALARVVEQGFLNKDILCVTGALKSPLIKLLEAELPAQLTI